MSGLISHPTPSLESRIMLFKRLVFYASLLYAVETTSKESEMTTATKRIKFSADYKGDFTPENVKRLEEATNCNNRSELISRAFTALDNELKGEATMTAITMKSSGLTRNGIKILPPVREGNNESSDTMEIAFLTDEEWSTVQTALKAERIDLAELIKRGLTMVAKTYASKAESKKLLGFNEMSYSDLEKLGRERHTVRGLSEAKLEKAFEMIQDFNRDQLHAEKKLHTSQDSLYKITNSNIVAIRNWVEKRATDLEEANFDIAPRRGMKKEEIRDLLADYMNR